MHRLSISSFKMLRFVVFVALTTFICSQVIYSLQHKNNHIKELYEMQNCDVLVLGSSHAYVNLNGAVLYDNYGIASSCIAQGEQQIRMSYYSLKSALRICRPKVVIFEVYMATFDDDYGVLPDQYAQAMLNFPIYSNLDVRIEALGDLAGVNPVEYVLGFPLYHKDYSKWYDGVDMEHTAGYMNGFFEAKEDGMTDHCFSTNSVDGKEAIGEKSEEALYKTIRLCKENNIDLVFVVTPYQATDCHMRKLRTVKDIAEEAGIPFVDMNNYVSEIGIDLLNDMYDWGHAKKVGEEKNSLWLGSWLLKNYDLEDRRGETGYSYWDIVSEERRAWEEGIQQ